MRIAFDQAALEDVVLGTLRERVSEIIGVQRGVLADLVTEAFRSESGSSTAQTERLKSLRSNLTLKIDRMFELVEEKDRLLIKNELADLLKRRSEVDTQIAGLQDSQPAVDPKEIAEEIANLATGFNEFFVKGTLIERKELIRTYIEQIELDPKAAEGRVTMRPLPLNWRSHGSSVDVGASWSSSAQTIIPSWRLNSYFYWIRPARKLIVTFTQKPLT